MFAAKNVQSRRSVSIEGASAVRYIWGFCLLLVLGLGFVTAAVVFGVLAVGQGVQVTAYHRAVVCLAGASPDAECLQTVAGSVTGVTEISGKNANYALDIETSARTLHVTFTADSAMLGYAVDGAPAVVTMWRGIPVSVSADGRSEATATVPDTAFAKDLGDCALAGGVGVFFVLGAAAMRRNRRVGRLPITRPIVAAGLLAVGLSPFVVLVGGVALGGKPSRLGPDAAATGAALVVVLALSAWLGVTARRRNLRNPAALPLRAQVPLTAAPTRVPRPASTASGAPAPGRLEFPASRLRSRVDPSAADGGRPVRRPPHRPGRAPGPRLPPGPSVRRRGKPGHLRRRLHRHDQRGAHGLAERQQQLRGRLLCDRRRRHQHLGYLRRERQRPGTCGRRRREPANSAHHQGLAWLDRRRLTSGGTWRWAENNPPGDAVPSVFLGVSFALLLLWVRVRIHRRSGSLARAGRRRLLLEDLAQPLTAAAATVLLAYGFWPGAIVALASLVWLALSVRRSTRARKQALVASLTSSPPAARLADGISVGARTGRFQRCLPSLRHSLYWPPSALPTSRLSRLLAARAPLGWPAAWS